MHNYRVLEKNMNCFTVRLAVLLTDIINNINTINWLFLQEIRTTQPLHYDGQEDWNGMASLRKIPL